MPTRPSSCWPTCSRSPLVKAWVRIDETVPLRITYLAGAIQRQYEPDFIVIDDAGVHWIVEGKRDVEMASPVVIAKRDAAAAWVKTVNGSDEVHETWAYLLASESVCSAATSWEALKSGQVFHECQWARLPSVSNTCPKSLDQPHRWAGSRLVFVNSMSDLFHAKVPLAFVRDVFDVVRETPQHTYQVLTKRATRLRRVADRLDWPSNLWMGVSVEDADAVTRMDDLRVTPAAVKFLSCEPLIGDLGELNLTGIDWVIVGGESGAGARPMDPAWAARPARSMRAGRGAVLLQAVGRKNAKGQRFSWAAAKASPMTHSP
jgi:protein gp37